MGIYSPQLFLSKDDVELLGLLATLVLEYADSDFGSNIPPGIAPLTDEEAKRLLVLLEEFLTSKKFVEGAFFIESLFSGADLYDQRLRDIYLSWRRRQGRSRAMATVHWRNFINRLGIVREPSGYLTGGFVIQAQKMEISYFLKMERKLLSSANLHPRVIAVLMNLVERRLNILEEIRTGQTKMEKNTIRGLVSGIVDKLRSGATTKSPARELSSLQLSSTMLLVADFSVLFTTRDWDACGVMSSAAAAIPYALGYDDTLA